MSDYGYSPEHQPVTWYKGHPVWAAYLVVIVFVASMLFTTIVMAVGSTEILDWLTFSSAHVLRGEIWRVFTYGFVNPPSISFAIGMYFLAWFGRDVERFFGRRIFLILCICVHFAVPLVLTIAGLIRQQILPNQQVGFAVFIAFATLYPNAVFLFNLLAKWIAVVLVAIYSLMALASNDWAWLIAIWTSTSFAFAFVRYHQGILKLPSFRSLRFRRPGMRNTNETFREKRSEKQKPTSAETVDALLDKIAQSGFHSLTPAERAQLDAARADILKREGRRK